MSIARIIAALVARGEEDLAEELLGLSTAATELPIDEVPADALKVFNDLRLTPARYVNSGQGTVLFAKPYQPARPVRLDKSAMSKLMGIKGFRYLGACAKDGGITIGLQQSKSTSLGAPQIATSNFSSKIKSNLTRAAQRTGGKLTSGGWNQIQVTFSFGSEKDAGRFYKSAEKADPEGWASPDEPYEHKGQWNVDVNA